MRTSPANPRRPVRPSIWRTAVPFLVTCLVVALAAPAASAHAAFVSADPAPSSVLTTAPDEVALTFNEDVTAGLSTVQVVHAAGASAASGDPQAAGDTVTQRRDSLRPGQYTVSYRVVSADGHPISGQFVFFYAPNDVAPPVGRGAQPSPVASSRSPSPSPRRPRRTSSHPTSPYAARRTPRCRLPRTHDPSQR